VEKSTINKQAVSPLSQFSLVGKTAIVTGATGVLGTVMTRGLASAGARVVILGRRGELAQQIASSLQNAGLEAMAVSADVLKEDQLVEARKKINNQFGPIDILVNAAGGNMPHAVLKPDMPWADMNIEAYADVLNLNLMGTVIPSKVFGEDMVQKKRGVIINIASVASQLPLTQVAAYSNSKAAIKNFTQWLAVEMARKYGEGIRVNAIAPGFFLADQNRSLLLKDDGSLTERGQKAINKTPFGRFGDPEELVGTLIWLCADASKFVTGAVIPVDGGFTAYAGV
jgi:NAD(P)-dependent dehydrogenase (short-subunit alcohol dehydrogenase family)